MAALNFDRCYKATLVHEGGWSDHPKDPGGATMRGVTQRVYTAYRRREGKDPRSVREISDTELWTIYRKNYWNVVAGDELEPAGIDYVVYDAAVNSGPHRGARWLQKALGVPADGQIGPVTLRAVERAKKPKELIRRACRNRMSFLEGLRHWRTFGRGWTRRVVGVEALAIRMLIEAQTISVGPVPGTAPIKNPTVDELVNQDARNEVHTANKAEKQDIGAAAGSGAFGGGGIVGDSAVNGGVSWIMVGVAVIAVVAACVFVWRSHSHRERKKEYRKVLERKSNE